MRLPEEFRTWIAGHSGVFTRAHALGSGITPRQFRTGTAQQVWVPYEGVWIVASYPSDFTSSCWAALFRAGADARITATSALRLYGMEISSQQVCVSVPASRHYVLAGVTLLRDATRDEEPASAAGLPAVERQRAVVDALRLADQARGREILHEALRLGWIDPPMLEEWCGVLKGHSGMRQLRLQLAYAQSGSRAESERLLLRLLKREKMSGWDFNVAIHSRGGVLIGIGDCVHVERRVVVEVDGLAWHTQADRFQRDRTRQNQLINEGWHVLRFTYADLAHRPHTVLATIRAALTRSASASGW